MVAAFTNETPLARYNTFMNITALFMDQRYVLMFRIVLVRPEHWRGQVFLVLPLEPHRDVPIRAKILPSTLFLFVPLYKSRSKILTYCRFGMAKLRWLVPLVFNAYILLYAIFYRNIVSIFI